MLMIALQEKLHGNAIAETGHRYGRLTVIECAGRNKRGIVLWLCQCDCSKEVIVPGTSLRRGFTKSCGCLISEVNRKTHSLPPGEAAFNHLFKNIKYGAKKRGYDFDLTEDQVRELIFQNCYYCDSAPSQMSGNSGKYSGFLFNGIDRVDNNFGYVDKNCVPCCKTCNYMKRAMNLNEFKEHIAKIYRHLIEGQGGL